MTEPSETEPPETELQRYLKEHEGEPYVWGGTGPRGYDASGFLKPTDWDEWIRRDRVGALKSLLRIELRYRLRLLRDRFERKLVQVMARRR